MNSNLEELISALCNRSINKNKIEDISVIETHISWVVLTGKFAYKIKKPIKFSFLDFSTLEKRKYYCEEELRLNRRLAPNLYLEVISIKRRCKYSSSTDNKVIEYAVKMLQFPQNQLLSNVAKCKKLTPLHIDDIASQIADFHTQISAQTVPDKLGTPENIHRWGKDNFSQIQNNLFDKKNNTILEKIQIWSEAEYLNKYDQFVHRRKNNFIRECHGDMHLGNMVLISDKVTIFDGIDFNEQLRWIDVVSEIAFTAMDLKDRGYPEYSYRFINLYMQHTGDYQGLIILNYYLVYRAMVRAKVALLCLNQTDLPANEKKDIIQDYNSYLALASEYTSKKKVALIITHGFSGSGKSTQTEPILESLGAIRIRSDIERKRLYGYASSYNTQSSLNTGIYSSHSSVKTYARLAALSKQIITAGYTVIVDACFLRYQTRQIFSDIAKELKVPFIILDFHASVNTLKNRIKLRAKNRLEPSEADLEVLKYQIENDRPFEKDETTNLIVVNTENNISADHICSNIMDLIADQ